MGALQVVWLGLVALAASYLCFVAVFNFIGMHVPRAVVRIIGGDAALGPLVLLLSLLIHAVAAAIVAVNISWGVATGLVSATALVWGLFAYFLLQRFAGPVDRTEMVRNHPLLLPLANLLLFGSSALALGFAAGWYWAMLPVLLWFILGLITAEIAIRRLVNRSEGRLDRQTAMFGVNQAHGRGLLSGNRYPFP